MGGTEAVQTSSLSNSTTASAPGVKKEWPTKKQHGLGQWLSARCQEEHLSLRQAAVRIGLSHATLAQVIKNDHASPETIRKLTMGFSGNGHQRLALEDHLLELAGYRTERSGEKLSEPRARLMDKVRQFDEPQLMMMMDFADFLVEIDGRGNEPEARR